MKQKHPTQPTPNDAFGQPMGVLLRNVGAVDIPAWSLLEVVDSYVTAVADPAPIAGQLVLKVRRPTSDLVHKLASSGPVTIPVGKQGPGFYGPVLPISVGSAPGVGKQCRSTANAFTLTPGVGPLLQLTSEADVNLYSVDCVQPVVGFVLTGSESGGSAPGNLIDPVNSTVIASGVTIYDPFGTLTGKSSGFKAACVYCWDRWIAVGGGSGGNAIGFANSGIAARSGDTPGKGDAYICQISADTLSATASVATVYNLSTTAIESGQYFPIHKEFITNQWVASEGGSGGGGGGGAAEPYCGDMRFEVAGVTTQTVYFRDTPPVQMKVASVALLSRPCGCDAVPEEEEEAVAEVFDPMGCHLNEDEADLIGRQGTAKYREPLNPPFREDGVYDEGYNFRSTEAYVTDGANETFVNKSTLYPAYGWEDATDVVDEDTLNSVDRRLAGHCAPAPTVDSGTSNTVRFKVDLPSAGRYLISLAMGSAVTSGSGTTLDIKLYDGSTQITYFSNSVGLAQHVDAQGTAHATADWPSNHQKYAHEFTTTEFIVELTGEGSKLNHVRIESATSCWWEIDGLCCPPEA